MTKGQKIWFVVLIILVVGLAGVLAYPYAKKYYNEKIKSQNNSSVSPTATTTSTAGPTSTVTPVTDPGVNWLSEPEKLDDLGLFKDNKNIEEAYQIDTKSYYKVANLDSGGSLVLAFIARGMVGNDYYLFKKDKDGKYTYIVNNSTDKENESIVQKYMQTTQKLNGKEVYILFDTATRFQSLSVPDFIQTASGVALKTNGTYGLFKDLSSPQKLADTTYGSVYKTYSKSGDTINGRKLSIKLADSQIKYYNIKYNFITDDEVALITWSDGTKNSAKYTPEPYSGCGQSSSEHVIINTDNLDSRLTEVGKTTDAGDKIYTVGKDDEVMKAAHDNYKIGRTQDILSLEAFAAKKPVFIWKDGFGDYIIFTGRDFAGLVECGKPVIYLYPEKTTNISVKVAANITKSDPEYKNGWQVTAKPSGKLTVAGKIYDYLFWEGQGQEYPIIDSGKVVETKYIEQTLRNDLAQLGLNQQESTDFMEFWLPKMPITSYVRLTWLGTAQMNKLAPLFVEPKPDTMIRIFLDFEGLDKPINISPQKLSAPERKGFTLIEWGGLLKGN